MAWEEFPHSLGQKQTSDTQTSMSALPPKADIHRHDGDVRFLCQQRKSPVTRRTAHGVAWNSC
jgi:hypothetical protein